jgi:hypothetical protein
MHGCLRYVVNREALRLTGWAAVIPLITQDMCDYRPQNLKRAEENSGINYLTISSSFIIYFELNLIFDNTSVAVPKPGIRKYRSD